MRKLVFRDDGNNIRIETKRKASIPLGSTTHPYMQTHRTYAKGSVEEVYCVHVRKPPGSSPPIPHNSIKRVILGSSYIRMTRSRKRFKSTTATAGSRPTTYLPTCSCHGFWKVSRESLISSLSHTRLRICTPDIMLLQCMETRLCRRYRNVEFILHGAMRFMW
jgi:hypothetical protein